MVFINLPELAYALPKTCIEVKISQQALKGGLGCISLDGVRFLLLMYRALMVSVSLVSLTNIGNILANLIVKLDQVRSEHLEGVYSLAL